MKITRVDALQAHPVPKSVMAPQGPFPRELFNERAVVTDYEPQHAEDGGNFVLGSTSQNNFKGFKIMICSACNIRVNENKTGDHVCEGA
jgi:hypothetical protein